MIPDQYIKGDQKINQETVDIDGKTIVLTKGVDVLAWLEDIEKNLTTMRERLAAAGGIIIKRPVDGLTFEGDHKKAEIALYEDNKKASEVIIAIKDPKKQMLKIYEFVEFIIYNVLASPGPDGKKMDHAKRKEIVDSAMRKVEEEEKKEEKVPQTPPKEEKKKS